MGVDLQKVDELNPSYIDLEVDIGRVVLPLPGPRDDAAYPSCELILRTNQALNIEDSLVRVQIKGEKNQSKLIPLTESDNDKPLKTKTFFLYGICSLGEVNENESNFE
jgi:hypothetical protein